MLSFILDSVTEYFITDFHEVGPTSFVSSWPSKSRNTIAADGKTRLRGGHLGLGLVSVLELAGEHLGSV